MEEYFYNEGHRLMQNDIIRQNQAKLNIIREERSEPWKRLETDGIFGRDTRDVIKEFQKKYCQPATGRLDERTQKGIISVTNQCVIQREQSSMRKSKPKVDLTVNSKQYSYYANPSVVCPMTGCAKVTPVASPPPVAPSIDPGGYEDKSVWSQFTDFISQQWSSIGSDIKSILGVILKIRSPKLIGVLLDRIKVLIPKIGALVRDAFMWLGSHLSKMIAPVSKRLQSILDKVKTKGRRFVQAINKNPSVAKGLAKTKTFAKNNAFGIILSAVPMVVNLFKWMTCEDSESADCEKAFWESFRSFLGAILIMIGIEVVAGALVAAGVVGGSVIVVAAVIGLIVAVIDIIVMSIREDNKGIGDLLGDLINIIFEGLEDVGKSLGDSVYEWLHPDVPKAYTVEELELMGVAY